MFGGISIWQLLIVLLIVLLIFGAKRLKNVGSDLGEAVKGFKKSVKDEEKNPTNIIDGKVEQTSESENKK